MQAFATKLSLRELCYMTNLAPTDHVASPSPSAPPGEIEAQLSTLSSRGKEVRKRIDGLRERVGATIGALEASDDPSGAEEAQALARIIRALAEKLGEGWSDPSAAHVLFSFDVHLKEGKLSLVYVADNIETWLENHKNSPTNFNFCLQIKPPPGIYIDRVLNAGAQKQVFVARWPEVTTHEVAFKHFHDSNGANSGDAFPHPLRGHHPNIIETFVLDGMGSGDDVYLVERLLHTTLSDDWDFGGVAEVVNLIRDIAHALSFVHGYNRIHGDIKLDNIGFEAGCYILLDFGLCRSEPADSCAWTPTGNVRALAPELLVGDANTARSDVWALGSVAFAALVGRPPFFKRDEKQQGFGDRRAQIIEKLASRVADPDWRSEIDRQLTDRVPELGLQQLLREMLDFNSAVRPTARQVFERCNETLGQYLRPVSTTAQPAPSDDLKSLLYLKESGNLSLASRSQQIAVRDAAKRIETDQLEAVERAQLSELRKAVDSL